MAIVLVDRQLDIHQIVQAAVKDATVIAGRGTNSAILARMRAVFAGVFKGKKKEDAAS